MAENSKSFLSDLSQKLTDQPDLTNKLVEFNLKRGREEYKGPKDLVNTETTGNETTSPVNKAHRSDSPYSPGDPISSEKLIQSEDNLSVFEMSKMEEKLAEALEELKSERQLRIDVQSQLQTLTEAQNHLAEGINLNTTFTNRNHRDLVDAMKISNRDQARLNGAIMKVQGADLMYLYDGEIGYSTWKKFVIQLLERLQLPDDLVKDIPLIHVGWGNVNETVSWKDKNKPVTKRPDDAVKKTHLEVICPTPGIPTFLKTRTGIDKIIKAKNNAAFGDSKFLSVTQLMGPASEKMNLYSSNTKGNMMKIIKEFKSIDQAKKAYVEEKYPYLKHINKIYCFGPHNADLKIVFYQDKANTIIPYEEIPYHPLTKDHVPMMNNTKSAPKKITQPVSMAGRVGPIRSRIHKQIPSLHAGKVVDEELLEPAMSLPRGATPYQYRAPKIPSGITQQMRLRLESFNRESTKRHDLEQLEKTGDIGGTSSLTTSGESSVTIEDAPMSQEPQE